MVQRVVARASWAIGDQIEVGFIESARCLLLRRAVNVVGYKLDYSNKRRKTGGRVYCDAFIRNTVAREVALPKKNLVPLFPKGGDWAMAVFLEPPAWKKEEFSKAGAEAVEKHAFGAYELLGNNDMELRIGEGNIRDRINAHLRDPRFAPPVVKEFRYLALSKRPADSPLLEKIVIADYEHRFGSLPHFQEIRG
jgi:hypothetical protein